MSRTIALSLVLLLATSSALSAQEPGVAKEQTFGDWTVFEFRDFDHDTPPPKGVADTARTSSLNADLPKVRLDVRCWTYHVGYTLSENGFYRTVPDPEGHDGDKIELMYAKTNKEGFFRE